jgi:hypothetical protein
VENYFNYFTEIEEHFLLRRGGGLLLSTLDWALIETWKDAGIPLEAVLRGIDAAFDRYEKRPSKTRKVNSLAYCAQEVLVEAEDMKDASVGTARVKAKSPKGFDVSEIVAFLGRNAIEIDAAAALSERGFPVPSLARETAATLRNLAEGLEKNESRPNLEDLERRLTVLEDKLLAALLATTPDEEFVAVRSEADRELRPYRRKMLAAQIEQLHKQFVHKRLLEKYALPRLSLFYM